MKLNQIEKAGQIKPPRVLLYGPAGIGKTTFGASATKPIYLPIEDGLGKNQVDAFPQPRTYLEARGALDALINEDHEFRTLVVDSLDWLEPMIWSHVCDVNKWDSIEKPGYGRGYVEALKYWREFLERINYLRDQKRMATIMIGHSLVKNFASPDNDAYDRYVIKLQQKASDLVAEHSDCIFFANYKTKTMKVEERGRSRSIAMGTGERVMYTEERPAWLAKNRYGLPTELPLDWSEFIKQLKGDN